MAASFDVNEFEENENRIEELPEDVLCNVISHLTLKEAGRTSIFSRKWKDLWKSTPHLCFVAPEIIKRIEDIDESDLDERSRKNIIRREKNKYIRWVNQVVDNHRGSHLEEFVIVFYLDRRHSTHLDNWMRFALRKQAKAIKIDLRECETEHLQDYCFFTTALVTSGIECLNSLSLNLVEIAGEAVECLLSVCTLLEELNLRDSGALIHLRVVGSSLKLKYLTVMSCWSLEDIEIYAPKLVSFHFQSPQGSMPLQLKGLCCLVDLNTYMFPVLLLFSEYFSQLETLKLDCSYDKKFLELHDVRQFTNVKHLSLKLSIGIVNTFDTRGFANFIGLCPFLQKLTLQLCSDKDPEVVLEWGNLPTHQYLKVVEMSAFVGRNIEVGTAKIFLNRFTNLEKLIIYLARNRREMDENGVNAVVRGSREKAEELIEEAPRGVELVIM